MENLAYDTLRDEGAADDRVEMADGAFLDWLHGAVVEAKQPSTDMLERAIAVEAEKTTPNVQRILKYLLEFPELVAVLETKSIEFRDRIEAVVTAVDLKSPASGAAGPTVDDGPAFGLSRRLTSIPPHSSSNPPSLVS